MKVYVCIRDTGSLSYFDITVYSSIDETIEWFKREAYDDLIDEELDEIRDALANGCACYEDPVDDTLHAYAYDVLTGKDANAEER